MQTIQYRKLKLEECERIREIDASQYIGRAWRDEGDGRKLIDIDYYDSDFPEGYEDHLCNLRNTLSSGGVSIGAFDTQGKLLGFVAINRQIFGVKSKYVLLDQLYVNRADRKCGIGKKLFMRAAAEAGAWNAQRLYICAGSAEETVAFYRAIGCTEAEEINLEFYESDPRDLQMEYQLSISENI